MSHSAVSQLISLLSLEKTTLFPGPSVCCTGSGTHPFNPKNYSAVMLGFCWSFMSIIVCMNSSYDPHTKYLMLTLRLVRIRTFSQHVIHKPHCNILIAVLVLRLGLSLPRLLGWGFVHRLLLSCDGICLCWYGNLRMYFYREQLNSPPTSCLQ